MSSSLSADVERILISEERLQARIAEIGRQITVDYAGKELLMVGVLKGAVMFMVDLARSIDLPVAIDFMATSSYGASTQSSGVVRILKDLDRSVEGKHLLIVEDIVDTGLTLKYLIELLKERSPERIDVCALLNKQARRKIEVELTYVGFDIPDEFVVGYGLDYGEVYRNLPYIGVLRPSKYQS